MFFLGGKPRENANNETFAVYGIFFMGNRVEAEERVFAPFGSFFPMESQGMPMVPLSPRAGGIFLGGTDEKLLVALSRHA